MRTWSLIGPAAICRLDDRLLRRIGAGDRLGAIALSAVATIVGGAGAYGIAFGIWRAMEQAAYSAVKLPALLLSVAACTLGLSVMLASVLRSKLPLQQTAIAILLSLAITAAALGAMAPVAIVVALVAPPPDAAVVGLAIADPRVAPSLAVARTQLLLHVAVIAAAGSLGVVRLRGLLARLGLPPVVLRRVLVSFLSIELLVGVELSWLLRPFFGRPHLPPTFSCDDLLEGSFFEELAVALRPAFGSAAPLVLVLVVGLVAVGAILACSARATTDATTIELGPGGMAFQEGTERRTVAWEAIVSAAEAGSEVHLTLAPDETLTRDTMRVACKDPAAARELARRIDAERAAVRSGPFRSSAVTFGALER